MTARLCRARRSIALLGLMTAMTVVSPASAAGALCRPGDSWPRPRPDLAAEVLALTNAHRASVGVSPLAGSSSLNDAAMWKAAHMAQFRYMTHDDPAPPIARTIAQRVIDCGYDSGAGENIAYGYGTPEEALEGWLSSAGHRRNVENTIYKVIGIGAAVAADGTPYWVQVFGTRVQAGDSISTPPLPNPLTTPTPTTAPSATPSATPTPSAIPSATPAPSSTPSALPGVTPSPENIAPDTGSQRPPVARDDSVLAPEDTVARITPLANDEDPDGGSLRIVALGAPRHGAVALDEARDFIYTPDANYNGTDSFEYTVIDDSQLRTTATVTVQVKSANDQPAAHDDEVSLRHRRRVVIYPLMNDRDVDGDRLRISFLGGRPYLGSVDREGDALIYRPSKGSGSRVDRITYKISDSSGASAMATIKIRIRR